MTPDQIIEQLKALYLQAKDVSTSHRDMWDDPVSELGDIIGYFIAAHVKYQETDWAKEEREKHVEDSFDGGSF